VTPSARTAARACHEVERPERVETEHRPGVGASRIGVALGDLVQFEHPVLLGLIVEIGGGLKI
jgi:hypothetical protein